MKKAPYPKGTLVIVRYPYAWCGKHIYITTSEPTKDKAYGSGYRQSATCLQCGKRVGEVDAAWWQLPTEADKLDAIHHLESQIEELEHTIKLLGEIGKE